MLKIKKNILLSKYSTFRIGGPAKFFTEANNEKELKEALEYAQKNKLKFFILGGGSNILFSDDGFDGLVIKLVSRNSKIKKIKATEIECWGGINLSDAVNFAKNNGLTGMENLAGIPGTIGGAVRGNAGAHGTEIGNLIKEVKTVQKKISPKACRFSYRSSIFKEKPEITIISVILKLKKSDKKEIGEKIREVIKKRMEKQPQGWRGSAGSYFKNPKVENKELLKRFKTETGQKAKNGKLPAGWLIAEAGFLGKKIGGVQVSEKHGNFIINTGKAKAEDVIMLASIIKQKVRNMFGVELQEEIQYVC